MNGALKKFLLVTQIAGAAMLAGAQPAWNAANLPLWFEANQGQAGAESGYVAHGNKVEFLISAEGAAFALRKPEGEMAQARMRLVGANPAASMDGEREMPGKVNYWLGNQSAQWLSGLSTYGGVKVKEAYPGIDVVYYGNQRQLEYDFKISAGANPQAIAFRFDGVQQVTVDGQGELAVSMPGGMVYQRRPEAYQLIHGTRRAVSVAYKKLDARTVAFSLGEYDHAQPLVIDPVLGYSTYFGGNVGEQALAMALDHAGNVYIAGNTFTTVFPKSVAFGVYSNFNGGGVYSGDAFVAKFDSTGTNLIYLTYLGGNLDDGATALAVDGQNNVVVGGYTDSTNFPTAGYVAGLTSHINGQPYPPPVYSYPVDAFITKLSSDGSKLLYSGYLGGNQADSVMALAIDQATENLFVGGFTYSTNFPVTPGALQAHMACTNNLYLNYNAFISVISFSTSNLLYSTFLGGTNTDVVRGLAFANGNLFVTGYTDSTNIYGLNALPQTFVYTNYVGGTPQVMSNSITPATMNGLVVVPNSSYDAFVAAFAVPGTTNPTNFALTSLYSMYLGGDNNDYAYAIAADANNNAYVAGATTSTNFPYLVPNMAAVTNLSFLATNGVYLGPATNGFLTQITWNGTNAAIGYSVAFGGWGIDMANALALDAKGNIYVVGSADSANFPTTAGSTGLLLGTNSGYNDAIIAYFSTNSALPVYSAYLGGNSDDFASAVAVDASNDVYVVGETTSLNFPLNNASITNFMGTNELFLAKIIPGWPTPNLQLTREGTNAYLLSWPPLPKGGASQLYLEASTNLLAPQWQAVTNVSAATNGNFDYGFTTTNPPQFFRLHQY